MRPGFKLLIALLLLTIICMLVGPILWGLFFGPGFDP